MSDILLRYDVVNPITIVVDVQRRHDIHINQPLLFSTLRIEIEGNTDELIVL